MTRPADLSELRARIRAHFLPDEAQVVRGLLAGAGLDAETCKAISERAARLVREVRAKGDVGLMQSFLAEYGLSTREGVALMCLAEALLRVPDAETIDALIEDKIAPSDWGVHLGHSSSPLVNASTWGLMLTGKVLAESEGLARVLRGAVRRLGEPVIRVAVGQAMRELGRNFVLGRDIEEALKRARSLEAKGYTYSYDMLGEAARADADARLYHLSYSDAITAIAPACKSEDIRQNPGISVKLSALLARYEYGQRDRVMSELLPRARSLALLAKSANMGFNIDAEEADRLDLSLDVIEAILSDPALRGWHGFGVVVQAYGPRAAPVLDWLHALATSLDRRIMVRLVKGAYWDTEIKRAQVMGLDGYPVFTRKLATDVSYIADARKLLAMTERIYPQFAAHNAHTVAAVLKLAGDPAAYEFQRLHGMGEALHELVRAAEGTRCRIYAPVGAHRDLLAYLVRRLLENGANSSFVNQIVDESIAPETIARDPVEAVEKLGNAIPNPAIPRPAEIFGPGRVAAKGWDLTDPVTVEELEAQRRPFRSRRWHAGPMIAGPVKGTAPREVTSPSRPADVVGHVTDAAPEDVETALAASADGFADWAARPVAERASILRRVSELYEAHAPELFAICAREAGKTLMDGVAEVREAVDFLRYYAAEAERLEGTGTPRGTFVCVSPWNFPLAIFTGQVAAALAAGNAVIAKPAEQSPLVAARAVELMREAGVPEAAIQLLPGDGPSVGGPLTSDPRVAGVCFTGSTEVAQLINRAMAEHLDPRAPLIAETGGLNAMIVDSTALPEQAVRDIVVSSFQSAGQRCSALRMLYVQKDVAERTLRMLQGAMDELRLGDPWELSTDVGPVIDADSRAGIEAYVTQQGEAGRVMKRLEAPAEGAFVPPTLIRLGGIGELEREVFGPVLHVATFEADRLDAVIEAINARGYGLTFGLHTRIDDRVQHVVERIRCGNIYVNRNQIGAVVGSQPFGGEGLSGTGPKAGGPHYVRRFLSADEPEAGDMEGPEIGPDAAQAALDTLTLEDWTPEPVSMPGPTGESNRLASYPRGRALCLGPGLGAAMAQADDALSAGNAVLLIAPGAPARALALGGSVAALDGVLAPAALTRLRGLAAVASFARGARLRAIRRALAARDGPIVPLVTEQGQPERYSLERHVCVDTTAAGGNASLLAEAGAT
ncbi:MAG TPA: bifunctional proline dehydrogenase/L-glutamate gamma-semialdehyde dehydrogenase PutA [Thermohalobaculum sp.]|nr:bifunctional proline dehydrogenase/L-glutamate gamma-semialdehyde dehydrogenase PutA [Thermohalobaculum sp.]